MISDMVLKASDSREFLHNSSGSEESKKCLVGEQNVPQAENAKGLRTLSAFLRILISFGFMKGIINNHYPERVISGDVDYEKRASLETCDRHHECESTQKESLLTKEESYNESTEKDIEYGTFIEFTDLEPLENMALKIKEIVSKCPDCSGIRITDSIALMIARDIIESAENEPCGLQGCNVLLSLEDRIGRIQLGDFKPKDGFLCTFEVNVVLNLRTNMMKYFIPFLACMPQTKYVSENYRLIKEKLYTCSGSRGSTPVH